uniref:Uncharacterized protein n=1 Tax=Panagrolaimus davidi TaxID=227884 RepID=A0A914QRR8_9BILA
MDLKSSYKSKLRSSSTNENNNVEMKNDEKIQPRKRIKIDADFTTPILTRELRSSKKVATPQAPRANRSILEASMEIDSPSSSQNFGSFDKTPKRKSLRKSRLSEGQPRTNVGGGGRSGSVKRVSKSTQTFDEKTTIGKLLAENLELKNVIIHKDEEIANVKRTSQMFVENVRTMAENFSLDEN